MPNQSVLSCPRCDEDVSIAKADHVESHEVVCPHCGKQARLRKVSSPTAKHLDTKVWDLEPAD